MLERTSTKDSYLKKGIKISISQEDFSSWAMPLISDFYRLNPGGTPSVDRIDPDDDYRLGNIRIIDMEDNRDRSFLRSMFLKREGDVDRFAALILDLCQTVGINPSLLSQRIEQLQQG